MVWHKISTLRQRIPAELGQGSDTCTRRMSYTMLQAEQVTGGGCFVANFRTWHVFHRLPEPRMKHIRTRPPRSRWMCPHWHRPRCADLYPTSWRQQQPNLAIAEKAAEWDGAPQHLAHHSRVVRRALARGEHVSPTAIASEQECAGRQRRPFARLSSKAACKLSVEIVAAQEQAQVVARRLLVSYVKAQPSGPSAHTVADD
eukprot:scaffold52886_cov27-Tisochrysis_lutea.AAC.2